MISVAGVSKRFGGTLAVDDVSFEVARGEILGLLGPNGAGKTTTMRILSCFLAADTGSATVAGFDVAAEPLEVRRRLGYLPENNPLYFDMTVAEYLALVAEVRRRAPRGQGAADRAGGRGLRARAGARPHHRPALQGLPAARRPRGGAAARPGGPDPRRADGRARPDADHRDPRADPGLRQREDRAAQLAHPPRGRGDLPARADLQRGAPGRPGDARRAGRAGARQRVRRSRGARAARAGRPGARRGPRRRRVRRRRRGGRACRAFACAARPAPTRARSSPPPSPARGWGLRELHAERLSLEDVFIKLTGGEGK